MKIYYTHGVSGGRLSVVEGKKATRQQVESYRKILVAKASEEINDDNIYRDGCYQVRKLNETYDIKLEPFIPNSDNNSVWMRDPDNLFEDREAAEVFVEERNKKLFIDLRDIMMTEPLLSEEPVGLKYVLKYSYTSDQEESE